MSVQALTSASIGDGSAVLAQCIHIGASSTSRWTIPVQDSLASVDPIVVLSAKSAHFRPEDLLQLALRRFSPAGGALAGAHETQPG
jgi:hypothetical protein